MIYFSRYCAIEIAPFIQEVDLNQQGTLFGFWNNRKSNMIICRLQPGHWQLLGKLNTITPENRQKIITRLYIEQGLPIEFNPIILFKKNGSTN